MGRIIVRGVSRLMFVIGFTITILASTLCVNCDKLPECASNELPWVEKPLFVPKLHELANAFTAGLTKNYAHVSVEIVDCPDLTKAPFFLASSGISGSQTLIDVGADTFLMPMPNFTKMYNFVDIARKAIPNAEIISLNGAGAGPYELKNSCSEGIYSVRITENGSFQSESRVAFIKPIDNSFNLERIPSSEIKFPFINSLFASEGKKGKLIRIKAKKRVGEEASFITICRKTVMDAFGSKPIGIGGVFVMKQGKALHHVQSNCTEPIDSKEKVRKWLKMHEIPAPLISLGTFITSKMDLDLRPQHFHSFTNTNRGGHYYNDTTPDTIEYEAYFNVADRLIRVDRGKNYS